MVLVLLFLNLNKKENLKEVKTQNIKSVAQDIGVSETFEVVAKEVVKKSIRSAICFDDQFLGPYSENQEGKSFETPKKLYESFREKGDCDLDIHPFKNLEESWGQKHQIINKDLMILDWELDPGNGFESTLRIIKDVVSYNQIPFIVIYTSREDLKNVCKSFTSQFCPYEQEINDELIAKIEKDFSYLSKDIDSVDMELLLEEISGDCFDYIHDFDKRGEIKSIILDKLFKDLQIDSKHLDKAPEKLEQILKNKITDSEINDKFLSFCQIIHSKDKSPDIHSVNRVLSETLAYKINGTTIILFQKSDGNEDNGVNPDELFSKFSEVLVKNPHTFLSILSLEFKDSLREKFSIVGSKFSNIDEKAFFYHMNNYRDSDGNFDFTHIYDFILNTWITELYHLKLNDSSKIIQFLDQFYKKLEQSIILDAPLLKKLSQYCLFVTNTINTQKDRSIRFGDTFSCAGQKELFFLCVTPHCDLINPKDKINDNLYFIKGVLETDLEKVLKNIDIDYYSFAERDNDIIAINWICKPFTFYLPDNQIDSLDVSYSSKEYKLEHIASIKENFAQRIANQSFGYGHRVGIDVPYIP